MKNKKSILWAFLALVVFCVGAIATGSSSSSDFVISGGVLTSYTGSDTTVYVPDGVTTISVDAFDDATISVIYLPISVTTVENDAFALCSADVKVVFEMDSPTAQLPSGMENWGVANAGGQITTYTTSGVTTYTLSDVSAIANNANVAYIKASSIHWLLYFEDVDFDDITKVSYTNSLDAPNYAADVSKDGDDSVRMWVDGTTVHFWFDGDMLVMPSDMAYYFSSNDLKEITGLNYLDTSNVTTMFGLFSGCQYIEQLDLSPFDTSNVLYMGRMFGGCTSLKSVNLSNFNTEKVVNMDHMFDSCESITNLDLSSFNTERVEGMYGMFNSCSKLSNLNISSFNTIIVKEIASMFSSCESLVSLDISHFNLSYLMYYFKEILEPSLDLDYEIGVPPYPEIMFQHFVLGCENLDTLYVASDDVKYYIENSGGFPANVDVIVKQP